MAKDSPQVRALSGDVFELVESIHDVEADGAWSTTLVFGVYGPAPGRELLCETRIKVQHERSPDLRTTVVLLSVTDMSGAPGYTWWKQKYPPQGRRVRAGRTRAPERGADLLSHRRVLVRNIAEAIELELWNVADKYGPWPKAPKEEMAHG